MKTEKFRIGQRVWFWYNEDYRTEKIVRYDIELNMWELSDGELYLESELYKSKKEAAFDLFPPLTT